MRVEESRVLVTGADGFIGSHLCERLAAEGAEVRALCQYNSPGSWGWLDESPEEIRGALDVRLGDIRDGAFVRSCCEGVDLVLHLAALISIPHSYGSPESFLDTNIKGTFHVLEALRQGACGRVVHTSTSEVYGTPEHTPIDEAHPLQGQSPYSASKIAADKLCESYACSFELPVQVLRPFNTYGPRQSARAVLPTILAQLLAGRTRVRLGSLAPRRDLTYVGDTVGGFLAMARSELAPGEVIQLGTGRAVSIGELFELSREVVGVEAEVEVDPARVRPAASEVQVLLSDPGRARDRLGWEPQVSLEEGLARTRDWVAGNLSRFPIDRYQT